MRRTFTILALAGCPVLMPGGSLDAMSPATAVDPRVTPGASQAPDATTPGGDPARLPLRAHPRRHQLHLPGLRIRIQQPRDRIRAGDLLGARRFPGRHREAIRRWREPARRRRRGLLGRRRLPSGPALRLRAYRAGAGGRGLARIRKARNRVRTRLQPGSGHAPPRSAGRAPAEHPHHPPACVLLSLRGSPLKTRPASGSQGPTYPRSSGQELLRPTGGAPGFTSQASSRRT